MALVWAVDAIPSLLKAFLWASAGVAVVLFGTILVLATITSILEAFQKRKKKDATRS